MLAVKPSAEGGKHRHSRESGNPGRSRVKSDIWKVNDFGGSE
uniref:Uncharacterized protein n=1 Tax=uncultured bacterium contig00174 TaxID=1181596 RepID=A0A806KKM6_9BACT|nr:hypothetical protein [uncultured bacterium contig00174]